MKIKPVPIFFVSLFIFFSASAQNEKLKFHSINAAGLSAGQSGGYFLFQTVNGLLYGKWYSGIGLGADYYQYNSYPIFIDARRHFGKHDKGFIYGDLGYNFSGKNKPGKEVYYYDSYHFNGGIYTDIGIGYKTRLIKKTSLLFCLGHSYKQLQTKIGITTDCLGCQPEWNNYKFGYGRITMKTGVEF
jgi:hypothetical protein